MVSEFIRWGIIIVISLGWFKYEYSVDLAPDDGSTQTGGPTGPCGGGGGGSW